MKLFTRYNRVNLLATIIIFLFASAAFYFLLRYILVSQVNEDLRIEQHEIETYVKEHNVLPEPVPVKDQEINYVRVKEFAPKRKFSTVEMLDSSEHEKNAYKILVFDIIVNGQIFQATVAKSLERTEGLIKSILLITSITILLILITAVVINRILLKRLWKPFYSTMDIVKNFRIDKKHGLHFPAATIDEFAFMNKTLEETTRQASKDYSLLKEFTENASHEMQTPLAIIRSKLDLFIQHENLSDEQTKTMQSAYQAVEKLSGLNQSLLLLAKIENNQYTETQPVNFKQKLEDKVSAFNELWQGQHISVSTSLADVSVNMNGELADILFNNLLSNATRYNFQGGFIKIELTNEHLKITNSSRQARLDPERLFSRFYRNDEQGKNGLGLSIVKQICGISKIRIEYLFDQNTHSFLLSWA